MCATHYTKENELRWNYAMVCTYKMQLQLFPAHSIQKYTAMHVISYSLNVLL